MPANFKHIVVILLHIIILSSCERKKTIVYEPPHFPKQSELEIIPLNSDYLFRYAYRTLIYDSLLIVATLNEEHHIAVFNRYSGNLISEFGKKGDAPNDLIIPTEYSIDYLKGKLYVNDYGQQAILSYDLHKIKEDDFTLYEKIKFPHTIGKLNKIVFLRDSLFISPDYTCRFSIASPNNLEQEVCSSIGDITKFSNDRDWNLFMKDYACHAISPNGNYWASGTILGGLLEIFGNVNNKASRLKLKCFYEPIFNKREHLYFENEETIGGFSHLVATDKHLYATVFGTPNPQTQPTQIWKLDWEGNPIEIYHCAEFPIECFSVCEEEGLIYAITTDEEGEQFIAQMKIKQ